MLAAATAIVVSIAMASPSLAAEPPRPGCPEDYARQGLTGAASSVVWGGEHLPGAHILAKLPKNSILVRTDMPGISGAAGVYTAMLQSGLPEHADWLDKAGMAFLGQMVPGMALGPEGALAAGLYGGAQSSIGSLSEHLSPGSSGLAVAKRAAINGMGNMALAGVTVLVIFGGAAEAAIIVPAMAGAGLISWASTWISAAPALAPCPPDSSTPTAGATCAVGTETITQMKYQVESARQANKSFNYGAAQSAMNSLMIKVTSTCEAEAVGSKPDSARTCAEQKEILKNFRGTVETACKTDPVWCALSKTTLHRVETKTNDVCERDRVANQPRAPRTKTTKRAPEPVSVQPQPGPSAADVATAVIIGAGIASAVAGRPRGPVYQQPRGAAQPQGCHRGPDGRIHCGRN
jgi:hypothetical protein